MALNTNNRFLNSLFNNLSSIYPKDAAVLNSDLFVLLNAYAGVFRDINRLANNTLNNTYLQTAEPDFLYPNFGAMINFPKPPRLNTLAQGDEIYRAILKSLYDAYLNGSTEESMDTGLSTIMSFLTIDTVNQDPVWQQENRVHLTYSDASIQLTYDAISTSGTFISGSNFSVNDFLILPSGIISPLSYDPASRTLSFTGFTQYATSGNAATVLLDFNFPASGQTFSISYYMDHTPYISGNWINIIDTTETRPLPYDLKTVENTFYNPKFSFWWSQAKQPLEQVGLGYNRDNNGIEIIDGALTMQEQALVWRLPEADIAYKDPYDLDVHSNTTELYNDIGQIYNISGDSNINQEVLQDVLISDYTSKISSDPGDYYVRYNINNAYFTALDKFAGSFAPPIVRRYGYAVFTSDNFGALDIFEKNTTFDVNDLFGFGTKHVWKSVAWNRALGGYVISNANRFARPYSLFEDVLFRENFESGPVSINKFNQKVAIANIHDIIGTPLRPGEDCMQLARMTSGTSAANISPIVSPSGMISGNHINFDFYDPLYSGSSFYVDIERIDPNNPVLDTKNSFRFGYDSAFLSPKFVLGASGNYVYDTRATGYIESYYQNQDEILYMFPYLGPTSARPMQVVAGNTAYPYVSNNSGRTTGSIGLDLIPNLSKYQTSHTDKVRMVWVDNTSKFFSLSFNYVLPCYVGTLPVHLYGMPVNASGTYADGYTYQTRAKFIAINTVSSFIFIGSSASQCGGMGGGGGATATAFPSIPRSNGSIWDLEVGVSGATLKYIPTVGDIETFTTQNLNIEAFLGEINPGPRHGAFNTITTQDVDYGRQDSIAFSVSSGTVINYTFFGDKEIQENLPQFSQIGDYTFPLYYYQQMFSGNGAIGLQQKNYLPFPRRPLWFNFDYNMGTDFQNTYAYLDGYNFLNMTTASGMVIGDIASAYDSNSISLVYDSTSPSGESAFVDNFLIGYRTPAVTRPFYRYGSDIVNNWPGGALDQSAIVDNKQFAGTSQGDFVFALIVKGLEQRYLFVIKDIINTLKPAHTLVRSEFEIDHILNTTGQLNIYTGDSRNWERGNVQYNTVVAQALVADDVLDLTGDITISGSTIH